MQAQLIAVAGDEEEGVVRAGTEDEHGEDARDGGVEHDAEGGRDAGRDDAREAVGDADDSEGHEPQPGAAVGDEEEHGDDDDGRQQQREVRALEDGRDVDLEAFRSAQVDVDAGQPLGGDRAQLVGALGLHADVGDDVEGNGDEGDRGVIRHRGRRHEVLGGELGQVGRALRDGGDVVAVELAGLAREDEQRGRAVGARQLLLQRFDLRGLGAVGQPDGRCRLLLVAGARREDRDGGGEGDDEHDPGGAGGGDEPEQRAHG